MLSSIVKPLIMWPSKDAVRANMAKCFFFFYYLYFLLVFMSEIVKHDNITVHSSEE